MDFEHLTYVNTKQLKILMKRVYFMNTWKELNIGNLFAEIIEHSEEF